LQAAEAAVARVSISSFSDKLGEQVAGCTEVGSDEAGGCSVSTGMVPTRRPQHRSRLSPTLAAARARLKAREPTQEHRASAKRVSRVALVVLVAAVAGFGVGQAASDGGSSIVISTSPSEAGEVAALRQYINRHGADRPVPTVPARAVTTIVTTTPR
jgi:hypothetical protein